VVTAQRQREGAELAVTLAERESRARLRQAEADAEKAAKDHARYRELFARETIAAQQLDQAKAADEVARATVEAARKQVARAEEALELARASRVAVALRQKEV
jgi:multidrug resistance efflux pump